MKSKFRQPPAAPIVSAPAVSSSGSLQVRESDDYITLGTKSPEPPPRLRSQGVHVLRSQTSFRHHIQQHTYESELASSHNFVTYCEVVGDALDGLQQTQLKLWSLERKSL